MTFIHLLIWITAICIAAAALRGVLRPGGSFPVGGAIIAAGALFAALVFSSSFGQVQAGARGVVLRFGAPTGEIKGEGLYTITPFITNVVQMTIQTEALPLKDVTAASKDLQDVSTDVTLNYHLDPGRVIDVYRDLRQDYTERITQPAIQEALKAATASYTAAQLITERPAARNDLEKKLRGRLERFGILIDALSITNFKFSEAYTAAIEAKVTATQKALEAQQKLAQVKFEADQVRAAADGQAYANRVLRVSITPEVLEQRAIEKWNGALPTYMGSNAPLPFISAGGGR